MRCEPIEAAGVLVCQGCGCTDSHACPGGCYWVSRRPPVCSACVDADELDEAEGMAGGLYGAERCPASATPAPHARIWVDGTSGYCARCRQGFAT